MNKRLVNKSLKLTPMTAILVMIYFGLCVTGCSGMFFVPEKRLVLTPDKLGLNYQDIFINTHDKVRLHGWLLEGRPPVKGTIVFLHGNAQNISYHISAVRWLPNNHFNVFLYDYRGYGLSGGNATIKNSIEDFRIAVQTAQQVIPADQQQLIVFGQSIGGSFAITQTARFQSEFPIRALVLDSAFSGFRRIAREKLKIPLITRPFSSLLAKLFTNKPDVLQQITLVSPTPVLIMHGTKDTIVPYEHAERLYMHAHKPKQLWLEPGARHIGSLASEEVRRRLLVFMNASLSSKVMEKDIQADQQ